MKPVVNPLRVRSLFEIMELNQMASPFLNPLPIPIASPSTCPSASLLFSISGPIDLLKNGRCQGDQMFQRGAARGGELKPERSRPAGGRPELEKADLERVDGPDRGTAAEDAACRNLQVIEIGVPEERPAGDPLWKLRLTIERLAGHALDPDPSRP
jgi:hypothetical protein